MIDEHQLILELKAECYDKDKTIKRLNEFLVNITKALELDKENNLSQEDLIDRIRYLVVSDNKNPAY